MNIVLKKVKYHEDMSDETNCFSAEIWADGKKLADVSNRGCGGENDYYPVGGYVNPKWAEFVRWCKANPPLISDDMTLNMNTDLVVGELFDECIREEDIRRQQAQINRWCKTQTVWRLKGDKPGTWHTRKVPYTPLVGKVLRDKLGDTLETIANEVTA